MVLWCSSRRRQHLLPTGIIRINNTPVTPVSSVRNLGVRIECDTAMKNHVTTVVRSCFAALRQIRSVQRSLSRHALITLLRALVVSKVDYCNSVLAGVSGHLMDRLQSVLNAAARLIFSAQISDSITPLLRELHWPRVPERISSVCASSYIVASMDQHLYISLRAFGERRTTQRVYAYELPTQPRFMSPRRVIRSLEIVRFSSLPRGRGISSYPRTDPSHH